MFTKSKVIVWLISVIVYCILMSIWYHQTFNYVLLDFFLYTVYYWFGIWFFGWLFERKY